MFTKDGQIRRRVSPQLLAIYHGLERNGRLSRLEQAGLVRTWSVKEERQPELVHERLPFVTYPQEWTFRMLKDAALCTLNVALELAEAGLGLQDAHPWNVSFRKGRAVYLDFSSIRSGRRLPRYWAREFLANFYLPLWLRSRKVGKGISRKLADSMRLDSHFWYDTPGRAPCRELFTRTHLKRLCWRYRRIWRRHREAEHPRGFLIELRDHLRALDWREPGTEWRNYKDAGAAYEDASSFSPKAVAVHALMSKLPAGRLVDVAGNRGWFTGLAATMGHRALCVDVDEGAIDYAGAQMANRHDFDVAWMDVLWPTPPQSRGLAYPSALERWRCDNVLMIAVVHHLVLKRRIAFDTMVAIARDLGARHVIAEWIDSRDVYLKEMVEEQQLVIPEWYSEERFVEAFSREFRTHCRLPSGVAHERPPGPVYRTLYLFDT